MGALIILLIILGGALLIKIRKLIKQKKQLESAIMNNDKATTNKDEGTIMAIRI